ncbi:MAG: nuclease-related domain-containing protein [Bryobacteraceae bacterium]
MAQLIPKVALESITTKSERDVARALIERLPARTTVYHSYPWLRPERSDKSSGTPLRQGEADFVVVDPRYGLLVLEVKGGIIEYDPIAHLWYRQLPDRRKDIKQPFEQAGRNMHALVDTIHQKLPFRSGLSFTFGYAVVFPDCDPRGAPPPGADPAIVLGAKDLSSIDQRLEEIFRRFCGGVGSRDLPRQVLDSIQQGLSPAFRLLPVLYRQIAQQEEALFRMTEDQERMLDFLGSRDRAASWRIGGLREDQIGDGARSAIR